MSDNMLNLPQHLKIKWAKCFLFPGIRRITTHHIFTSKEWIKFFDWAWIDSYKSITKYIKSKKGGNMGRKNIRKIGRSAKTGKFTTVEQTEKEKDTHTVETIVETVIKEKK